MILTFLKISLCLKYDIDLSPRASRSTLGWPISSSQCTLWQNFHPPILQLNCLIKHSPFAPPVGYLLSQQKCKGPAIFRIWTFKHVIIFTSCFNINHNKKDVSLTNSYYKTKPGLPTNLSTRNQKCSELPRQICLHIWHICLCLPLFCDGFTSADCIWSY